MGSVAETITPYGPSYSAGLNFALGNVLDNNPAHVDIVIAPGGAGRGVAVYNSAGTYVSGFVPYGTVIPNKGYTGGLRVAVGNLNGTGEDSVAIGTAAPQPAHVEKWNYNGKSFVEGPLFNYPGQGVYLTTVTTTPGGLAYLVVGSQISGSPELLVQNTLTRTVVGTLPGNGLSIFDYGNTGEVRLGEADVNGLGVSDIVVTTGSGTTQEVRVFDMVTGSLGYDETYDATQLGLPNGYNSGLYVG
jgi:hypothetical protein